MSKYSGSELELFQHARNWKAYYSLMIRPFLGERVLEVGAGLGASTPFLHNGEHRRWVCLESDPRLATAMRQSIDDARSPNCQVIIGTIAAVSNRACFDAILYIDVLEHIADAREELARAALLLRSGGYLVVLVPSHEALYTEFDKAIGHHRRYDRDTLNASMPNQMTPVFSRYLDSAGILLSLGNKALRSPTPTSWQIDFWDRVFVPFSRLVDPLLGYRLGKSLLEIRQKTG